MLEGTAKRGLSEQKARKEQLEQVCLDRSIRKSLPGQVYQDRFTTTSLPEQGSQERWPVQDSKTGLPGKDWQDEVASIGQIECDKLTTITSRRATEPGYANQDRTARKGQA
jgi:hypothetical protein